ncbi:hypothetical protein [Microbacterium aurantiacum]|uniref:hypothetical protein n=1 Tax=Microbacterium aurantiacum TaxID=162393 RepID=UPI000C806500|nr:hypothetical protein [Microbacterium aurantiacum]
MSSTWVDYSYFADELNVKVQTIRVYATARPSDDPKKKSQRAEDFPQRVNDAAARTPYFDKAEADAWIAKRKAEGKARKQPD